MELLRPILELGVVIPGMLLAYFPVKSGLKQPLSKLVLWLAPLLALLCAAGGAVCYARRMPTAPMLVAIRAIICSASKPPSASQRSVCCWMCRRFSAFRWNG